MDMTEFGIVAKLCGNGGRENNSSASILYLPLPHFLHCQVFFKTSLPLSVIYNLYWPVISTFSSPSRLASQSIELSA